MSLPAPLLPMEHPEAASGSDRPSSLVIGVGNWYRQDDRAGLVTARLAHEQSGGALPFVEEAGDLLDLIDAWEGAGTVYIIDAVAGSSPPGTVHRFEDSGSIPRNFFRCSTHDFGVGEVIELARTLGRLPARIFVYGIEGASFEMGEELTEPVRQAAERIAEEIVAHATQQQGSLR